jgi:hypothetical protein
VRILDPQEYLEIRNDSLRNGKHYPIVTGEVHNVSDTTVVGVQVEAIFYHDNTTMGSRVDNIMGRLPPGNKYNFEIDFALADQRATGYELQLNGLELE